MGAGVKALHFSTVDELLFSFYVMFLFFSQAPCHLEHEQVSSGGGSLEIHHQAPSCSKNRPP